MEKKRGQGVETLKFATFGIKFSYRVHGVKGAPVLTVCAEKGPNRWVSLFSDHGVIFAK